MFSIVAFVNRLCGGEEAFGSYLANFYNIVNVPDLKELFSRQSKFI